MLSELLVELPPVAVPPAPPALFAVMSFELVFEPPVAVELPPWLVELLVMSLVFEPPVEVLVELPPFSVLF